MTAGGFMDILPEKLFSVYIENLTVKPVKFAEFLIVSLASNVPSCITYAGNKEPCTTESGDQASAQRDSTSSVHAFHNRLPELRDEQVDCQNAGKESVGKCEFKLTRRITSAKSNMSLIVKKEV